MQLILGKNDTDVNPKYTVEYLEQNNIKAKVKWLDIEHRIKFEVLKESFEDF